MPKMRLSVFLSIDLKPDQAALRRKGPGSLEPSDQQHGSVSCDGSYYRELPTWYSVRGRTMSDRISLGDH